MKEKARSIGSAIFSQVGFFWLVLLIFMVVSVTASGEFFNKAFTHGAFGGSLGYAVATVFDLLSLVCMIARMNASRIADKKGEWLALLGVVVCAGVSAFANVASAVQAYQISQFSNVPIWMQEVAPYLGMVFPGMIIIVTLIADHVGDLNPQRADSVANYRAKEEKKVALLRVRFDIEKQMADVKKDMAALHEKPSKKIEKMRQEHAKIVTDLHTNYDAKMKELSEQIAILKSQIDMTTKATENATNDVPNPTTKERTTEPLHVVKSSGKNTTRQATPKTDFVAKVVAYQERHPNLTLAQIAQHFSVSIRTLQRRLNTTTGATA